MSWRLVHPFEGDDDSVRPVAEELHQRIIDLLDPLGTYLQAVEAAYLTSGPPGVITVVKPDGTRAEARRP